MDDWELKWSFGGGYAARLLYTVVGVPGAKVDVTIKTATFSNDSTCKVTGLKGYFCLAEGLRISLRKGEPRCLDPAADGVDWSGCDMQHRNLWSASLVGADLRGTDLSHAFLRHADLRRANLRGGSLAYANVLSAKVEGAVLVDTNLTRIDYFMWLPVDGTSCRRAWERTPGVDYDSERILVHDKPNGNHIWECYWPKGS